MLFCRLLKDPRPNNPRPPRRPSPSPAPPTPPATRGSGDTCHSNSGSSDNSAALRRNTTYKIFTSNDDHNKNTDQRGQDQRSIHGISNSNNTPGENERYRRILISRPILYFKTKLCNVICVPISSTTL
ncbi:hypothetical protein INT45_009556 [Circinella minor]|uniref:Uncharacterized protein n=1 Tax=Circinella minor TaxID=1195481 RepID=A0A8H7S9F5_9FUNG|nr:hypothetical protein INT45_009556 [Circinella minor]